MEVWQIVSKGTCCVLVTSKIMLQHIMGSIPHTHLYIFSQRVELYNVFVTALLSHRTKIVSFLRVHLRLYVVLNICQKQIKAQHRYSKEPM